MPDNHCSFVRGSIPLLVSAFVECNISINALAYIVFDFMYSIKVAGLKCTNI